MKIVDLIDQLPKHPYRQYKIRPLVAIKKIAVHHSLTDDIPGNRDVFAFARYHIESLNWPAIGYHYVIDRDGTVYKCNPATRKTHHVGKHNYYSLGVCLVGDFRDSEPSQEQQKALYELSADLCKAYNLSPADVVGHSEFEGYNWKKCPSLGMDEVRKNLEEMIVNGNY